MDKDDDRTPIGEGLTTSTPLGGRIGKVQVAVRPPDPILIERITEGIDELGKKGIELPLRSSLGVRSVDGFYHFRSLRDIGTKVQPDVISVVNYDPVRRTFILSGKGELNDISEFIWFAFEAFPMELIIFHSGTEDEEFTSPDQMDERVSFHLSKLRIWKDHQVLDEGSGFFWRGKKLEELFEFLEERFN
jgi:hypothetical protein